MSDYETFTELYQQLDHYKKRRIRLFYGWAGVFLCFVILPVLLYGLMGIAGLAVGHIISVILFAVMLSQQLQNRRYGIQLEREVRELKLRLQLGEKAKRKINPELIADKYEIGADGEVITLDDLAEQEEMINHD